MKTRFFIRAAVFIGLLAIFMPGMAISGGEALFIKTYFNLLRSGRLPAASELLEEPLLSQRRPLLQDNPSYAEFLASHYRTLQVEILRVQALDEEHSAVDLALHLKEGDPPLRTRFILRRYQDSWKLLSEKSGG